MGAYKVEPYWSEVAANIKTRQGNNIVAGDDEPYYRYKRNCFLKQLHGLDFEGRTVLEVGCGPGGNLMEVLKHKPKELQGADISEVMLSIAGKNLPKEIKLSKSDHSLPYADHHFDIVYTATVLQHNTDDVQFNNLLSEIARVSAQYIYLFERVEKKRQGNELCLGRPIQEFDLILNKHQFTLKNVQNLNIYFSYLMSGVTRKLFNSSSRKEGEPISNHTILLQTWLLPITTVLDRWVTMPSDLTLLVYEKKINTK